MTTVAAGGSLARLTGWTLSPVALRRLAVASVVANVGIVVTGGAVRLSGSGLGCPTWPRCSGDSLVPSSHISIHKLIEFGNRSLTFVLGVVLLATFVAAWRQRTQVRLALVSLLGVPAQAVLGGIVVLTHLNPWLVAAHFLLSAGLIGVTMLLWWRLSGRALVAVPPVGVALARGLAVITAAVLAIGTVVTGTGPHAGDLDEDGRLHRIHLSPAGVSQLHADAVMVLIGATVGMLALVYAVHGLVVLRRAVLVLLGIELAQGVIGYTQYFLHVPALLVGFHMLGACLVWLAALRVLLMVDTAKSPRPS
ncbi:MAG: cytochrome oxidase assembly [Jatrophihabitans sp.]|nr:cytochrome oxidase assembly [Jatrophihabitans sp.]